jgi:hypothetical protein
MKPSVKPSGRHKIATLLLALLSLVASAVPSAAATRTVTNLYDNGTGSLRDTIATADALDTINFGVTGTINLTSGELLIDKTLIITGPGAGSLTVRRTPGSDPAPYYFRLFKTDPNLLVRISGLTLTNGLRGFGVGGALYNSANTSLTLTNCIVTNNTSLQGGGGIYNAGNVTATGCVFSGNSGTNGGGGILNDGTTQLTGCTFSLNTAPDFKESYPFNIPDRGGAM